MGKGRSRIGEGGLDEAATVVCIACIGNGLLDPEDGMSVD